MGETERRRKRTIIGLAVFLVATVLVFWVALPTIAGRPDLEKMQKAADDLAELQKALGQFQMDCGRFPDSQEGLRVLYERPAKEPNWAGPYVAKERTMDPWKRSYVYVYPYTSAWGTYDLRSLGADGKEGGTGSEADIGIETQ